ncbi:MAG: polysaccharide deacetylase family protein [Pseudomonadota bacterium]
MRQRLVVLNYHQVPEQADWMKPDQVDRQVFRDQLHAFKRYFNVLPLAQAMDALRNDALPSRALAITFDDGYRDNHDVALEELDRAGCAATFFIATDFLDGGRMWNDTLIEAVRTTQRPVLDANTDGLEPLGLDAPLSFASNAARKHAMETLIPTVKYLAADVRQRVVDRLAQALDVSLPDDLMMSAEQIRTLHSAGMEVGGHTSSHPILLTLSLDEARADIARGRDRLTDILGHPPRFFAYPNGKYRQDFEHEHTRLLPELGFNAAFTTQWGYVDRSMPLFELPRVGFSRNVGLKLVLKVLRSYFDTPTEFSDRAA